jgi:hypothetical protein
MRAYLFCNQNIPSFNELFLIEIQLKMTPKISAVTYQFSKHSNVNHGIETLALDHESIDSLMHTFSIV